MCVRTVVVRGTYLCPRFYPVWSYTGSVRGSSVVGPVPGPSVRGFFRSLCYWSYSDSHLDLRSIF